MDVFDAGKSLDLLARIIGADPGPGAAPGGGGGRGALRPSAAGAAHRRRAAGRAPALERRSSWPTAWPTRPAAWTSSNTATWASGRASRSPTSSTSEQARRLFRRLALLDLPVFSGWLSAALLDQPPADAEDLLDELVNAQLVEIDGTGSGVHSQYRFHDLIRVFARERLAAEEPAAERMAALERALGALLYLAEEAHRGYYGGDYLRLGQRRAALAAARTGWWSSWWEIPWPGSSGNAPRWSPGYGRRPRPGSPSCAGVWRSPR